MAIQRLKKNILQVQKIKKKVVQLRGINYEKNIFKEHFSDIIMKKLEIFSNNFL